jgi:hypothetical protein
MFLGFLLSSLSVIFQLFLHCIFFFSFVSHCCSHGNLLLMNGQLLVSLAYVATIIRRGIGLTTGFIGSHTVTHNYSVYSSLQFTITLAESSHCIFTRCLSSIIAGSVRLQLNSSLKTAARPEYSLVTAGLSA